jgi:hypothetical protein
MTNDATIQERAKRCRQTLTRYSDEDRFICLIDLLADAMHWCDHNGENFHYALAVAGKHYLAELNDEPAEQRRMP